MLQLFRVRVSDAMRFSGKEAMKNFLPTPSSLKLRSPLPTPHIQDSHRFKGYLLLSVLAILIPPLVAAPVTSAPDPCPDPLNTKLLQPDVLIAQRNLVTVNTISPTDLTTPSFWWVKKQIDQDREFGNKFIINWIADQDKKQVDVVVNRQLWTILDYIGRYRFVNKFGTVARDYKYDVRIFNQQGAPLATYNCNYSTNPANCQIKRCEAFGQDSLGIPRAPLESP
jgi:hypothetical protein